MSGKALVIGEYRSKRQRPLAVRRRPQLRRGRLLVLVAFAVILLAGVGLAGRWLLSARLFTITRVEAGPYRFTAAKPLEELLAQALGRNIWAHDTASLAEAIGTLPWIRDVSVVRRLPGTLAVTFREWRPLLIVAPPSARGAAPQSSLVMLENGRVVVFPDDLPPPALPMLVGVALDPVAEHEWSLPAARASVVLDLLGAIGATGLETASPVEFIVVMEDGYALDLRGDQQRLLVGAAAFDERLRLFLNTREKMVAGAVIDLRFRNRVGVVRKA